MLNQFGFFCSNNEKIRKRPTCERCVGKSLGGERVDSIRMRSAHTMKRVGALHVEDPRCNSGSNCINYDFEVGVEVLLGIPDVVVAYSLAGDIYPHQVGKIVGLLESCLR